MRWFKRNLRKIGVIVTAGLLLAWVIWISLSVLGTQARRAPAINVGAAQVTPTADTTAVVQDQLRQQDEKARRDNSFPWTILNAIGSSILLAAAAIISTIIGFSQWRGNRNDERKKERDAQDKDLRDRAEERFKTAVTALGDKNEGTQVGGAILLRSFLNKDEEEIYDRYYTQIFDLAVAYLRLPRVNHPSEDLDRLSSLTEQSDMPQPLRQMLIVVLQTTFPLARDRLIEQDPKSELRPEFLDASRIQLDNAWLIRADLNLAWMPWASLRNANLREANLREANLSGAELGWADLREANLREANLSGADKRRVDDNCRLLQRTFRLSQVEFSKAKDLEDIAIWLSRVNLSGANLSGAELSRANLIKTNLSKAYLNAADLREADLRRADLSGADLSGANLSGADLSGANLSGADLSIADLSGTNLGKAKIYSNKRNYRMIEILESTYCKLYVYEEVYYSWQLLGLEEISAQLSEVESISTNLRGVKGLTEEQLEACKAKGAIIDEAPMTPVTSAQMNTPPPDVDGSNTTSSQSGTEL